MFVLSVFAWTLEGTFCFLIGDSIGLIDTGVGVDKLRKSFEVVFLEDGLGLIFKLFNTGTCVDFRT